MHVTVRMTVCGYADRVLRASVHREPEGRGAVFPTLESVSNMDDSVKTIFAPT